MKADLIIHSITTLATLKGPNNLRRLDEMKNIEVLENGFIACQDGKIIGVGTGSDYNLYVDDKTELVDGNGYLVTPGLIDSHTHLVHGGSRENEFDMKLDGVPYLAILNQGGGILSTVKATRKATHEELFMKAKKSLDIMLTYGVTTVEAKSGYGLNLENEIKQLEVAKQLNDNHPVDIKSTFMGAHALPIEYKGKKDEYIEEVINMLPVIKEKNLAEFCDIFCEDGVFTVEDSRKLLTEAQKLGFKMKIHADEIEPLGGTTLACEIGCVSSDHLMATTNDDIDRLSDSKVVANLLPATSFYLDHSYARARHMINMGCGVALSSDYNPGSCPSENLQFVMQLGSLKLGMTPKEVLTAVTMNAACCVSDEERIGSIEIGKAADFVLFDVPSIEYMMYHFGVNHVKDVYKNGKLVVKDQKVCY